MSTRTRFVQILFRRPSSTAASLLAAAAAPAQDWVEAAPFPRGGQAMAYDLARDRMVRFGGLQRGGPNPATVFGDTCELVGSTWSLVPGAGPPARSFHALVADLALGRTILFGGVLPSGTVLADTWHYQNGAWTFVQTAHAPPARSHHAMAHDLIRSRIVLYGGGDSAIRFNDTWVYDGTDWSSVPQVGPPPLVDHAMAFDLFRARTVLYGGTTVSGISNQTWEFDGSLWRQGPSGPPSNLPSAMAYDLARSRVVVFGWRSGPTAEVFEYDGATWTSSPTPVPARESPAMAYDIAHSRIVVNGGFQGQLGASSSTFAYDGSTWTTVDAAPPPQGGAAFDPVLGATILFGGWTSFALAADTWFFRDGAWRRLAATGPTARRRPGMAYLAAAKRVVLFGGSTVVGGFESFLGDTWTFDGAAWRQVLTPTAPSARLGHAMAQDAARGRIVLFGGTGLTQAAAGTWEFDGRQWTQIATPNAPSRRAYIGMASDPSRGRIVLYGGSDLATGTALAETWEYDGTTWRLTASQGPGPRVNPTMVYDALRRRIVLFGGVLSGGSDTWDFDGVTWTRLATAHAPRPRSEQVMTYDTNRNTIMVFGHSDLFRDTWELQPAPAPTFSRYGQGCAGSNGTPSLDNAAGSLPALGTTLQLQLSSLPTSPGFGLVLLGLGLSTWHGLPLPIPLDGIGLAGCGAWIAPGPIDGLLVAHGGSTAVRSLTIPADAALAGLVVGMQALVLDPVLPAGLSVSNAAVMRLH